MGTEFLKIKESEDALEIIQNLFDKYYTLQSEEIAVEDAYGRVLSGDVYSRMDFPPFDKALKDGFAILSQDSFGASEESPKTLEVIDFLEAGSTTDKIVEEGKCVEISTGAAMPEGADAVVMVEYCEKMDSAVNILTTVTPTQDVAKKGSDTEESKLILKKGDVLTPGKIGVLLETDAKDEVLAKDICLHIASSAPEFVSRKDIPASVIEEETRIEMGKEDLAKKPEQIRAKIVEGRVNKLMAQRCLVEQPFVKNPEQTIEQLISGKFNIVKFDRYVLGEGLEKRNDNFADEVMSQLGK